MKHLEVILKEVDKIRLNRKFDTNFKVKSLKEELLKNKYNGDLCRM